MELTLDRPRPHLQCFSGGHWVAQGPGRQGPGGVSAVCLCADCSSSRGPSVPREDASAL